jgi:hypothetical protein
MSKAVSRVNSSGVCMKREMKSDLSGIESFESKSRRGRVLDQLLANFVGERPLSIAAVEELWGCLSPEESNFSLDTVAVNRVRALLGEGKPVQAYAALLSGLKLQPTNLSLQIERSSCLSACHGHLDHVLSADPQSPLIEVLYQILLREAYLNPLLQGRYCSYLVRMGQFAPAAQLALPLMALYPAMTGLRDTVEEIHQRFPNEMMHRYLQTPVLSLAKPLVKNPLTARRARELTAQFKRLQVQVQGGADQTNFDLQFREVIGEISDISALDLSLKEFYYLKAVADGNYGRHWDSILLLQSLVEADPCNLYYRQSLAVEVSRFSDFVNNQVEKGDLKIDLRRAYQVLREIAIVPFSLLKQVCLSEVALLEKAPAKEKMHQLCALNPFDGDYLLASLDVAIEASDDAWIGSIIETLEKMKLERPWDLTVAAFETAP